MSVAPQVGALFVSSGGYKAVVVIDFLETERKIDALGCRYGGFLLAPGKDVYCWWLPDGTDPRRPDASLSSRFEGEYDPVYQPILEQHEGTPRALANFYSRYEDIKREWGHKTPHANRLQRIGDQIISHVVNL